MIIDLTPEFPVTEEACQAATGKTLLEWSDAIAAHPEFAAKRREAIAWMWDQVGRSPSQAWWGTTAWVEHERRIGRLQKDGRLEGYNICVTKSISAPILDVQNALLPLFSEVVRVRECKDIRAKWLTPGVDSPTEIDVQLTFKDGKTGINIMHNRIQTRSESDGLRRAWTAELNRIKKELEGK